MLIGSAEIERSGVNRNRANSIMLSLGRIMKVQWRMTEVVNKLGHSVIGNRKYVDRDDAIAALKMAIAGAKESGNIAKIHSIPNKKLMIKELKALK